MIVTGGGRQNGMLLREMGRLTEIPPTRIDEAGIDDEALAPASAAVLALLYIDQIPGNHPALTNAEISRVLGRLTPGSPQSWQRLLAAISGTKTAVRPLRSAV